MWVLHIVGVPTMVHNNVCASFACNRWLYSCRHVLFSGCVLPADGEDVDSGNDKASCNDSVDANDDLERVIESGSDGKAKTGEKSFPPPAGMKTLIDFTVFWGKPNAHYEPVCFLPCSRPTRPCLCNGM